jgi:hypothetical protein
LAVLPLALLGTGCANMYNEQISDIDSTRGRLVPFEVQASSTGVSVHDGAAIAKAFAPNKHTRKQVGIAEDIVALTQMGPQTGEPTFDDDWADGLVNQVLARCPSGHVTGLSTRREAMKYPVISGEMVTIKGFCIL